MSRPPLGKEGKHPYIHACRRCGCTKTSCCTIVTQRGTRQCQWYESGLCDNPRCLISEAQQMEKPQPDVAKASVLRERADNIRRNG